MRSLVRLVALFAALTAALLCAPLPVRACIKTGPLRLEGYPRDGAEDVPLDVLPVYQLTIERFFASGGIPDGLRLLLDGGVVSRPDAGALTLPSYQVPQASLSYEGGSVAVTVRHHGNYFEIAPDALLLPRTQYTLEVRWQDKENANSLSDPGPLIEKRGTVRFRTGDAPYEGDASPPAVSATQFVGAVSSCDPVSRSVCFSLPDDEALYQAQFEDAALVRVVRGSFFSSPFPGARPEDEPDCMIIRRRAPNGTLGEPARSCRAERTVVDVDPLRGERGIAGLACKSDGLYLVDRPLAELFAEQERANEERAREEAAAEAESESPEPEASEAPRARKDTGCSLARAPDTQRALGALFAALAASLVLRRQRSRRG